MKRARFTEEQIIAVLKEHEAEFGFIFDGLSGGGVGWLMSALPRKPKPGRGAAFGEIPINQTPKLARPIRERAVFWSD
jgi:hypothetical protein